MSTPRLLLVAAVGLVLLIGAPLLWLAERGPDRVGEPVLAEAGTPTPPAAPSPTAAPSPSPDEPIATPTPAPSPTRSTDPLEAVRPRPASQPVLVRIPAIGVEAAIVEVGTAASAASTSSRRMPSRNRIASR
jgi:hypothetical protein